MKRRARSVIPLGRLNIVPCLVSSTSFKSQEHDVCSVGREYIVVNETFRHGISNESTVIDQLESSVETGRTLVECQFDEYGIDAKSIAQSEQHCW